MEERKSLFPSVAKYPQVRDIPIRNPFDWLTEKRELDNVGPLWRVHENLYDLSEFIRHHPGGSDWISMSRGMDITEAFETHHATNMATVMRFLAKYYVGETNIQRKSPYTFEDEGFFRTLKKRTEPIFQKVGTGPSSQTILMVDSLCLLFLVTFVLSVYWDSTVLQMLCGYILAKWNLTAHNFFHFRDSFRKYYYDFSFNSSYEHRIAHVFSHHMYPNTEMDLQFSAIPASSVSKLKLKMTVPFLLPLKMLRRIYQISVGIQSFHWENLIVYFQLVLCIFIAPSSWLGIKSWIMIHVATSSFYYLAALIGDIHDKNVTFNIDNSELKGDFGILQVSSVLESPFPKTEKNDFEILTSFGDHALHHLYPAVCHSKLNLIKDIFRETLMEFHFEKLEKRN